MSLDDVVGSRHSNNANERNERAKSILYSCLWTADLESFSQGVHLKRAIIGPPVKPAGVPMMAQQCWLGSFVIFHGIRTSIAKKLYFCEFSGGGGGGGSDTLWIRAYSKRWLILQLQFVDGVLPSIKSTCETTVYD